MMFILNFIPCYWHKKYVRSSRHKQFAPVLADINKLIIQWVIREVFSERAYGFRMIWEGMEMKISEYEFRVVFRTQSIIWDGDFLEK